MPEQTDRPDPGSPDAGLGSAQPVAKKKNKGRKKDRIRAAWIGFASRILAQFIGAAASVVLGLLVVRHYTTTADSAKNRPAATGTHVTGPAAPVTPVAVPGTVSLAVLPMKDFSPAQPSQALADGLTEALIAGLAQTRGLRVTSRTSSMHYKETDKPLRQIAEELDADLVVEGSVVQAGGRVRVTAQLIEAGSDAHLWAQTYDLDLRDSLDLQSEVATLITRDIGQTLTRTSRLTPVVQIR